MRLLLFNSRPIVNILPFEYPGFFFSFVPLVLSHTRLRVYCSLSHVLLLFLSVSLPPCLTTFCVSLLFRISYLTAAVCLCHGHIVLNFLLFHKVFYRGESWLWVELVPFACLGCLGGLGGALFIKINSRVSAKKQLGGEGRENARKRKTTLLKSAALARSHQKRSVWECKQGAFSQALCELTCVCAVFILLFWCLIKCFRYLSLLCNCFIIVADSWICRKFFLPLYALLCLRDFPTVHCSIPFWYF